MVYRASAGGSGASGTVNSGTAGQYAYYATSGTAVSGNSAVTTADLSAADGGFGTGLLLGQGYTIGILPRITQFGNQNSTQYALLFEYAAQNVIVQRDTSILCWSSTGEDTITNLRAGKDSGINRVAAGVLRVNNATANTNGYMQWGGQARVTADVSFVSTATLANVTGLSASVTAARTYQFECVLYTTANVAGGIKAAVNATAAATFVRYEGYSMHVNTILGQTRATAVATAVGGTTTAIAATVFICGTITPSATGTFTVQAAQNATVASATVVLAGSYLKVYDTP